MLKISLVSTILALFTLTLFAQNSEKKGQYKVEFSKSEILLGNPLRVTFVLENIDNPRFETPNWSSLGFEALGGMSQSSSYQIVNGKSTSTASYTFTVRPIKEGKLKIPPFSVESDNGKIQSEATVLTVLPNPDGIVEDQIQSEQRDSWGRPIQPEPAPKKKRNTVKL